jgi:hypothetical protein
MCKPDENRMFWKQEETLMSWIITLEDMLAQDDNLY